MDTTVNPLKQHLLKTLARTQARVDEINAMLKIIDQVPGTQQDIRLLHDVPEKKAK